MSRGEPLIFRLIAAAALAAALPVAGAESALRGSLAAGEQASYSILVPPDSAGVVIVGQEGIDVQISLVHPVTGETIQESSMANGSVGEEVLVTPVSPSPSAWEVVVKPVLPRASRGPYSFVFTHAPADERARLRASVRARFHEANVRSRSEGEALALSEAELLRSASDAREAGDLALSAESFYQAGLVQDLLGESPRAIESMHRALPLFVELGMRGRESRTLDRLGDLSRKIGRVSDAEQFLDAALPIAREVQDPETEADILNNSGLLLSSIGRRDEAITMLSAAVPLAQEVGSLDVEAALHHNVGQAYWHLGDSARSLEAYERSMVVKRKMGSPRRLANTLSSMAGVHFALGDSTKALATVNEALELWEVSGSRPGTARSLAVLGRIQHASGDAASATEAFAEAVPLLRQVRDHAGASSVLASWAEIDVEKGELDSALEKLEEALRLSREASDRRGEARVLAIRARALRGAGELDEAIASIAEAVVLVEAERGTIARSDLRSSYLAVVRRYYDLYIELLLQAGDEESASSAAFRVSERARSRALLEGLAESAARIRKGIDPALAERERTVQAEINAREAYRARLAGNGKAAEAEAAKREINDLIESWRMIQAEIRRASPAYAALKMPEPATAESVRSALLDPDTALVEYYLGEENGYAWVITSESISVHRLPPRAEIERIAREWHDLLSRERTGLSASQRARLERELASSGERLSAAVLAPFMAKLGGKRLLVVADGALHYVPFAALPLPGSGEPLLTRYEIAHLPSASVIQTLRSTVGDETRAPTVAIFADPVFSKDDPRLTGRAQVAAQSSSLTRDEERRLPGGVLPRLRFSRREAEAIVAAAPAPAFEALDFAASKQTLISDRLRRFGIIHIATHGALNTEHPELSSIVLSLFDERGNKVDGFLRLHEIYNLELDAEMVVLSACKTALGKEIHGEGLVGVTRGFMYAGASRVISTIWNVDDRASARLMARFYDGVLSSRTAPAAALREAQLYMYREARWRDPHYWAAFGLYGEWR